MNSPPVSSRCRPASPGVAMVVTLMMMSVLVMMVVGLAGVMRNEQAAGRNLTYQILADQMADIGARAGMAAVLEAGPGNGISSTLPHATGPGWSFFGSERLLCSTGSVANRKNLEEIGTNSLILSLRDRDRGYLQANWVTVVPPGGNPNVPVGRYAWWVDDEGSKANLNAGAGTNTNILGMITGFPLSLPAVFKNGDLQPETAPWATGTNLVARTNAFLTPESLKDTNAFITDNNPTNRRLIYRRNKGHLTAWSSNVDLNPWGESKVALTNLLSASAINNNTEFANLLNRSFANSNVRSLFGRDFLDKYGNGNRGVGSNVIRQTMANAYESMRFLSNTTSPPLQGTSNRPMAGTNVPADYQGLSPGSLYINEIVVQPYFNNLNVNQCQVQVWVYFELINVGPNTLTNDVMAIIGPTNNLNVTMTLANGTTYTRSPGLSGFFKTNGTTAVNIGGTTTTVGPGAVFTNQTWVVFAGTFETPGTGTGPPQWQSPSINDPAGTVQSMSIANFQLSDIVLVKKYGGRRPTPVAVDWVQGPLPPLNFTGISASTVTVPFVSGGYSGGYTDFTPAISGPPLTSSARGFSRTDPRARIFPSWANAGFSAMAAYTNQTPTWGAANPLPTAGGVLPGGLTIDAPATPVIWMLSNSLINTNPNVPSWTLRASSLATAGFTSVSQLGRIHTGLPWRTLRLGSQSDSSGSGDADPPDWLLMDLFTASTNPTAAAPRLNPNTRISHGGGTTNRPTMVPALLASLTNTGSWLDPADRWTSGDWQAATNSLSQSTIPWIASSPWVSRRTAAGLPNNAFFFTGELMEVEGIGNVGTSDNKREAAAAALGDMVNPRSDTFCVWSVGQGLAVNTNVSPLRSNVMGEVYRQTVFQRVPQFGPTGALTGYQFRVLYTRNHLLE